MAKVSWAILIVVVCVLALGCVSILAKDELALTVYHTMPGDDADPSRRVILRLENTGTTTLYTFGYSINDVRYALETLRDGKWVPEEQSGYCATGSTFYPIFPKTSIMIMAYEPTAKESWRVIPFLYKAPRRDAGIVTVVSPKIFISDPPH